MKVHQGLGSLLPALALAATLGCDVPPASEAAGSVAASVPSAPSAASYATSGAPSASTNATPSAWLPSLGGSPTPTTPPTTGGPIEAAAGASAAASADTPPEPPPSCPADMVLSGRTCVDRYEAHLLVPGTGGALVPHPYNERPPEGVRFLAANAAGQKPQGYISRVESLAACQAAGKRLCSRREWQSACRGKGGARYPYGHRATRGRCNSGKPHLLTVHFGEVRNIKYDEHFNSPLLNADPVGLAASGAYPECTSEIGTFDMVGSLHEWVAGMVDADFVYGLEDERVERRDQPWRTGNGIFMGGFYSTTGEHGGGCEFTTFAHEPTYHDYSTGFRCCRDATLPPRGKTRQGRGR